MKIRHEEKTFLAEGGIFIMGMSMVKPLKQLIKEPDDVAKTVA
jgi:hypothetical protein